MRALHADLITAQQSGNNNPYIKLLIDGTDYGTDSDRLISLEHWEEPFRDYAVIILGNADRSLDSVDFLGESFTIGYGYVDALAINRYCGDGAGSEAMPTLWVKSKSIVSIAGKVVCMLEAEGAWAKLREFNFITVPDPTPPYINVVISTETIFELIRDNLTEAGFTLNVLGTQDDGIVNTTYPTFTINYEAFETPANMIKRLLDMTKGYLRQVEGGAFEFIYPQDGDTIQETYYSNQAPYFKEYVEKTFLLVPNSIQVYAYRNEDGVWTDPPMLTSVLAQDADSIAAYGTVTNYVLAPFIKLQNEADRYAEAILVKLRNETQAGRLVLPFHDARVELFDKIQVQDFRGVV